MAGSDHTNSGFFNFKNGGSMIPLTRPILLGFIESFIEWGFDLKISKPRSAREVYFFKNVFRII